MKILLVTSHFYPENFKANDMAFELAKRGHEVTVLAPIPDYPHGKYHEGYGVFKKRKETIHGVKVYRTFVVPRHDGSPKWLITNYITHTLFACFSAILFGLGIRGKFDCIVVHETSPIMVGIPAVIIKKMKHLPLHFWVLDLWPESLSAAGGINNRFILNVFGKLTAWIYSNCDNILISSKGFRKSINKLGDFNSKITYFPNWVDNALQNSSYSKLPEFGEGFNVIFAGNIGDAQDIPHLLETANLLKDVNVNFYLFGDGRRREWAENYITDNKLENIHLMGRYPLEAMPYVFSKASVLFLSLKDTPIFSLTVPAKLQAYMSSGKPIVAMINGEGADLIKEAQCGWSVPAGNSQQLADLLKKLTAKSTSELNTIGKNGLKYCHKHFQLKNCISNLEQIILAT